MRRLAVLTTLLTLGVPAAAGAATADGTVVGEPAVRGSSTVVPVALTAPSAKALRLPSTGTVKLTVRRVRGANGTLKASALRLGDVVRLAGARRTSATRAKGTTLRVRARGDAPSFAKLDGSLEGARKATEAALSEVARITSPDITSVGGPSDEALRDALLGVRHGVNLRISDLRAQGRGLEMTAARIGPGRRITPSLSAAGQTAIDTAAKLDEAVGVLDTKLNHVGRPSAPSIPLESTSAVTKVLLGILDLLRDLP